MWKGDEGLLYSLVGSSKLQRVALMAPELRLRILEVKDVGLWGKELQGVYVPEVLFSGVSLLTSYPLTVLVFVVVAVVAVVAGSPLHPAVACSQSASWPTREGGGGA